MSHSRETYIGTNQFLTCFNKNTKVCIKGIKCACTWSCKRYNRDFKLLLKEQRVLPHHKQSLQSKHLHIMTFTYYNDINHVHVQEKSIHFISKCTCSCTCTCTLHQNSNKSFPFHVHLYPSLLFMYIYI